MQHHFSSVQAAHSIIQQLDELPSGIDPDFDSLHDELELEFAAIRLTLGNGSGS